MMNLLMAFILAFYFQKWHFMAFWDGKFGIPLAKNVGNTAIKSSLRVASLKSGLWYSSHFKHLGTTFFEFEIWSLKNFLVFDCDTQLFCCCHFPFPMKYH